MILSAIEAALEGVALALSPWFLLAWLLSEALRLLDGPAGAT